MSSMKEGYKLSEVGVIPQDWEVKKVKEAYQIHNNLRFPISEEERSKIRGEYPYYGPTKIQGYLNEFRVEGQYALIGEDGDHFLKWQEMPMTILTNGKFNVNNHAHIIKGIKNSTAWFYYYFKHRDIVRHLTRQGAGRYKLTKKALEELQLPIPSNLLEQNEICKCFDDIEGLIISLEKFIAKKRNIKQGAVQSLLNGTATLQGFNSKWHKKTLGKVATIKTGKKNNEDKVEDGIYPFFVRSQTVEKINSYSFNGEAILVPGEGGIGTIIHYINGKFDYHQRVYKISNFSNDTNAKFVYYSMMQNFNNHATKNSVKATVDSLRLPTFQEFEFLSPSFDEQTAIANALTEMDNEIIALEKKLTKFHHLKQGMMQDLLTGKKRLPI